MAESVKDHRLRLSLDPVSPFESVCPGQDQTFVDFMVSMLRHCPLCLSVRFQDEIRPSPAEINAQSLKGRPAYVREFSKQLYVTPDEVEREARQYSQKLFDHWYRLKWIVERFEATIRKRWLKRDGEKRKRLLLTAWPSMPASHRPDFDLFVRQNRQPIDAVQLDKNTDVFLWPQINLEDLLKPQLLLIFLNARGRHPPNAFFWADFNSARFGMATGRLLHPILGQHMMMFAGRNTPEKYGELTQCYEEADYFKLMVAQKGNAVAPGHGLVTLEIQERIYSFLVKCCMLILHDINIESSMFQETVPVQPEPPVMSTSESDMSLLATVTAEAPYRLPAEINLQRLRAIIAAKRSAAEDHIWSLREDPGYFAETVVDRKEHRPEVITDADGKIHPSLKLDRMNSTFWERVLRSVVGDAYLALVIWDDIERQIGSLQSLMKTYESEIRPGNDLPSELEDAFYKLIFYLKEGTIILSDKLQMGIPASLPLRSYFDRVQQPNESVIELKHRGSLVANKTREHLMLILFTLWDHQMLQLVGLHPLMDELERLVQTDRGVKELLSPWVMSTISDLSVMSECQHQICHFEPWAATFEFGMIQKLDQVEGYHKEFMDKWDSFCNGFKGISLSNLGTPTNKFLYPVDKRRTRQTVEVMRLAEANLDTFWNAVDAYIVNQSGIWQHESVHFFLYGDRTLHRTSEWVEPMKEVQPELTDNARREESKIPLSQLYSELEQRTQRTVRDDGKETSTRLKVKTRGVAQETAPTTQSHPLVSPKIQSTIAVDKRALQVFSILFHTPSRVAPPGEVLWTEFLHAMTSVGFEAEKLYGSVWQFTPRTLDVKRSIQFHEPHPRGRIPFLTARRHGRRLLRAYGWQAETFKLAD